MDDVKDKGYITPDELYEMIKAEDPSYVPPNVSSIRPAADISNIIPITLADMLKETPKPIEYVLSPCLPTQGIGFVYAATGLGKTLFTLNLAYAIAQGGSFLKYTCPFPRRVLYVDGEMSYSQLHSRLSQINQQQGEMFEHENLRILTPDKIAPFRMPMIDEPYGQDIYLQLIQKYDIEVVVFDNLSMLASFDENKSHEWKIIQDWFLYLRAMGKTIITVHHSGKEKQGYRGTSRILDCADVAISLQQITDTELEEESILTKKFKIVYQKARAFGGRDALPFEVTLHNGKWSYQSMQKTEMDQVIDMVGLKMNQRDIAKDLGLSLGKVNKLIRKAKDLRLIRD